MKHASSDGSTQQVEKARQHILAQVSPIQDVEHVALTDALERILAQDIIAPHNVPPHDNAAMDGYAFRFADLAATGKTVLTVVGKAYAGHPFKGVPGAHQAIRIMTGATIPHGADTVVMQEDVLLDGDTLTLPSHVQRAQHVRRAGEDLAAGSVALAAGRRCGPAELGLIASLGLNTVSVYRRLRVAFFSSGDELVSPGTPLASGQIYDSNRYTLYGVLSRLGCEAIDLGSVRDEAQALREAFQHAAEQADVVITSGGVSVGDADFIRPLLEQLGQVNFWKLDMKPGRPMAFGKIGKAWIFGLPGNPVATMVAFYQLVADALLKQAGQCPLPDRRLLPAFCQEDIPKRPGKREFLRGCFRMTPDGIAQVISTGAQGSGMLTSMTRANCFIVLPEEQGDVRSGERVWVQLFDGLV